MMVKVNTSVPTAKTDHRLHLPTRSSCLRHLPLLSQASTPRRKTMEEVWKDINLASLNDPSSSSSSSRADLLLSPDNFRTKTTKTSSTSTSSTSASSASASGSSFGGVIFQDFLGRPFSSGNDPSIISTSTLVSADPILAPREESTPPFTTASPPSLPQPATALSLSSVPEFRFLENMDPLRPPPPPPAIFMSSLTSSSSPLDAFACSPGLSPLCSKKRVSDSEDNSGNLRHKRMIKNRESAARSRARKQESLFLSFSLPPNHFFVLTRSL